MYVGDVCEHSRTVTMGWMLVLVPTGRSGQEAYVTVSYLRCRPLPAHPRQTPSRNSLVNLWGIVAKNNRSNPIQSGLTYSVPPFTSQAAGHGRPGPIAAVVLGRFDLGF